MGSKGVAIIANVDGGANLKLRITIGQCPPEEAAAGGKLRRLVVHCGSSHGARDRPATAAGKLSKDVEPHVM